MGAPRYPSGPRPGGVRMPQGIGNEFNGVWIIILIPKNIVLHIFQFPASGSTNDAKQHGSDKTR